MVQFQYCFGTISTFKTELLKQKNTQNLNIMRKNFGDGPGGIQIDTTDRSDTLTLLYTLFTFLDANTTPSREKDDLRNTIRHLEEKLRAANRAEKPLEETGNIAENEKALKTTEELARSVLPEFFICRSSR